MSARGRTRKDAPRLHLRTDRVRLYHGDCADIARVVEPESIDAIVTDPPAGIAFMGKAWDEDKGGRDAWIEWLAGILRTAMTLLKPGGHALVWALPRTSHWTATAVEDAGFEIRDVVMHLFGTGFPKSLDVAKAIDASALTGGSRTEDMRRVVQGDGYAPSGRGRVNYDHGAGSAMGGEPEAYEPRTPAAERWQGWGTALKPAAEHWILARKPMAGTVASNVVAFGTGGLNINGCRIGMSDADREAARVPNPQLRPEGAITWSGTGRSGDRFEPATAGRWPAHLVLDEEAAAVLDAQSGDLHARGNVSPSTGGGGSGVTVNPGGVIETSHHLRPLLSVDGGASRFFYVAKATRAEKDAGLDHLPLRTGGEATDREEGSAGLSNPRAGAGRGGGVRNHHPTVKSIELMRWLCRLITPPGGTVLDLFTGSGTTGLAALREGFRFVGCEQDAAFVDVAAGRLAHVECVAPPPLADEKTERVETAQPSLFDARTA